MCINWCVLIYQWPWKYCFYSLFVSLLSHFWLIHFFSPTPVLYLSLESWVLFLLLLCSLMMWANCRIFYSWWSYSFVCTLHYVIIIIIKRMWRYCTSKMLVRYILSSVRLRLRQVSELSFIQYVMLCIQLTHFSCDDYENTCALSYYHNQIGSMARLPLLRVRSWKHSMPDAYIYV